MTLRAFLDLPDGMAIRIGFDGLLVGRHRSCDLQLVDETASRRHALLRLGADGVELVVLGKQPVEVNGRACTTTQQLHHDDRLRLPGFEGTLRIERVAESVRVDFSLRRGQERFQIHTSPFVVGGGATARVVIAGWPAEALRFRIAQGILHVELSDAGLFNGTALLADTPTVLRVGDELAYRGETFHVECADAGDASTVVTAPLALVTAVVLHPLPRGGRVTFSFADGDRTVYLPGRRFQLVSALLAPPDPQVPGEFVPDSILVPLVWHDTDEVGGRQDINVLLTRCRQDLLAAGIAGTQLLERAPGGRATRLRVVPGARIRTATD